MRKNWNRRLFGVLICLSPVALGVGSIASGLIGYAPGNGAAVVIMAMAMCLAALNFFLSFLRPLVSKDSRNVSGIPVIGSMLVVGGLAWGFGLILPAVIGLIAYAIDTGGCLWILIATWKDSSFWDAA